MDIETGPKIIPPSEMLLIVKWTFNEVVLIQLPVDHACMSCGLGPNLPKGVFVASG